MKVHTQDIQRPPGPKDQVFGFSQLGGMFSDFTSYATRLHQTYGDAVYLRMGHLHEYFFFHPDQVREVLVEKAKSFGRHARQIEVFAKVHGQSVLTTEGQTWQRQRRMLLPAFSPKSFGTYAEQIALATDHVLKNAEHACKEPVDFEHMVNMLTMDAIMRTMFGTASNEENLRAEYAVRELSRIGYEEVFWPVGLPDWLPIPSKNHKRRCIGMLENIILRCIDERRSGKNAGCGDLLDQLISADDAEGTGQLSDKEIRDQCMTIFLAGHDTTAAGLTWAGWCLASHPEIAAKAAQEADIVLQGRLPTFADLPRLPYIGQIVRETLRLYPPAVGTFLRQAIEDVEIGGWRVPKGSLVAIMSFVIQRDPRWYPDSLTFDPERFNDERSKAIPRGAYIPFGTGPRVCIGSNFAMMEMTLIMAILVQRFTLSPLPEANAPGLKMTVALHPKGGLKLLMKCRGAAQEEATVHAQDAPVT